MRTRNSCRDYNEKQKEEKQLQAIQIQKRISKNVTKANLLTNPFEKTGGGSSSSTFFEVNSHLPKQSSSKDETQLHTKEGEHQKENPLRFQVTFHKSPLPRKLHKQCMTIFQENMSSLYQTSSWGLDLDAKSKEFLHPDARFLIIQPMLLHDDKKKKVQKICAFSHFRFEPNREIDPTEEIMYVYEIQVDSSYQKFGIGGFCMKTMEQIAIQTEMRSMVSYYKVT